MRGALIPHRPSRGVEDLHMPLASVRGSFDFLLAGEAIAVTPTLLFAAKIERMLYHFVGGNA